ncbi:MAG: hypothetical protein AAB353_03890 [Candidatus Hydrogenedentota bacterium]
MLSTFKGGLSSPQVQLAFTRVSVAFETAAYQDRLDTFTEESGGRVGRKARKSKCE